MQERQRFQVFHFSTASVGGAGIAARRLSGALNSESCDSVFVSLANSSFNPGKNEIAVSRSPLNRVYGAFFSRMQSRLSTRTYFTLGSSAAISQRQLNKLIPSGAIVHIHNWFNLLSVKNIQKLLAKGHQVVFTMHDMRLLTGGCHYSLECSGYLKDCSRCPLLPSGLSWLPSRNLRQMRHLFSQYPEQVLFIAPSKWLQNCSISAGVLPPERIVFVPNFHFEGDTLNRTIERISRTGSELLKIGVASLNVNSPLKGGDLIREIKANLNGRVQFVLLSDTEDAGLGHEEFWRQIDYLLVISRADNSPNVIHEAKFHHVPVIGSQIGGITELLNPAIDIVISQNDMTTSYIENILLSLGTDLKGLRPRSFDANYKNYISDPVSEIKQLYKTIKGV
jgi:glycosyltransferase involved in cell wall biosynthesis